jgi:DNA-binding LacI/PurR family transcriptional regulator
MAVTLEDVAKLAGVSHMTVSLVIRNDKRITEETRQKVLNAIKQLNYQPNYLARGLAGGKTNTIAVVATFFSSFFELNILKEMETISNEPEYYLN